METQAGLINIQPELEFQPIKFNAADQQRISAFCLEYKEYSNPAYILQLEDQALCYTGQQNADLLMNYKNREPVLYLKNGSQFSLRVYSTERHISGLYEFVMPPNGLIVLQRKDMGWVMF